MAKKKPHPHTTSAFSAASVAQSVPAAPADPLGGSSRLTGLLTKLDKMLSEPYAFDVFAKDSINFGDHGDLPADLGAAELPGGRPGLDHPARAEGDAAVHDAHRDQEGAGAEGGRGQPRRHAGASRVDTSRVEAEIVDKAQERTNFNITATETLRRRGLQLQRPRRAAQAATRPSSPSKAKKEFHESVLKSAQEYRQQHRTEIDTQRATETRADRRSTRSRTRTTSSPSPTCSTSCSGTYRISETHPRAHAGRSSSPTTCRRRTRSTTRG